MREIIVLLDNIRSALNVGAIIRTCDGAGIKEIFIKGITPEPSHPKVAKTSLSAEQNIKFTKIRSLDDLQSKLDSGYELISIEESSNSKNFFEQEISDKVILVFGHEITGVSKELLEVSDNILHLPMLGTKRSLNVATTAGIVIYNLKFGRI
ncbi:MAG: hypothetical protein Kow0081_2410 [Candidatus Dojkabacteria bacterium]